jgi:hypothetical protein
MGILSQPDRRGSRRRRIDETRGITGVRIQSEDLCVINLSRGGVVVECARRLLPGTDTTLDILRTDAVLRVRGRVVRSEVTALQPDDVRYQVALAFNEPLDAIHEAVEHDDRLGRPHATPPQSDTSSWARVLDDMACVDLDPALALNSW